MGPILIRCLADAVVPAKPQATLASVRPSSFRESQDQVALSERQEAFLLERLSRSWSESDLRDGLSRAGLSLNRANEDDWQQRVLLMRSRLGVSIGWALVAVSAHVPHVAKALPWTGTM